jgi:hypothetical protein
MQAKPLSQKNCCFMEALLKQLEALKLEKRTPMPQATGWKWKKREESL